LLHIRHAALAAAIAAAAIINPGTAGAQGAQPKVEVSPANFDFGTVDEGTKSKAVYTLKNTGGAELIIYDIRPTCGCTVANLSKKIIPPGDSATLEAIYDSHNASGQVRRFINVRTNAPDMQTLSLALSANVKPVPAPDISFSLYNVTNLQLPSGGSAIRSINVTNTGQLDLVINEVTTSQGASGKLGDTDLAPGQTRKVTMTLKPGETTTLNVTVAPKVKAGNFQEIVTIRSNAKRRPAATFIAQGVVQG